jgi:Domain of unknown function (DUF4347)
MANTKSDVTVLLDPTQDGIAQITNVLSHYQNLTAVEIVSHGNTGEIQLGKDSLNANSLSQHAAEHEIIENMRRGTLCVLSTHINKSKESIDSTNHRTLANSEAIGTNGIIVIQEYKLSGLTSASAIGIIENSPSRGVVDDFGSILVKTIIAINHRKLAATESIASITRQISKY